MIKRTLYFGNPAYLSTRLEQLEIKPPGTGEVKTVPIEDIGVLVLDHPQITITQTVLAKLLANNTAVIHCDHTHHPVGMLLNLDGHTLQSRLFAAQLEATEPLKKQLWQQTVAAKIRNQAAVLGMQTGGEPDKWLLRLAREVKSGDSENAEAAAAAYYWKRVFQAIPKFTREREGEPPNNLLNYGYAILRAVVARSLTGSGLLPTLGIHHRNQYNAYCLADDIMEPYRPYVDQVVCGLWAAATEPVEMTTDVKKRLLAVPAMDVVLDGQKSPLMNAVQRTTAGLAKCYEGKTRKLIYPEI